jgi:hypothetical protein
MTDENSKQTSLPVIFGCHRRRLALARLPRGLRRFGRHLFR